MNGNTENAMAEDCLVYYNHGFNLLEELVRHRFTDDKRLAELLVIRSEEFVYGLIILDRLTLWSEEIHQRFQTVIECFNEQLGIINERFCFFEEDEDQHYNCPYENNEGDFVFIKHTLPRVLLSECM